VEAREIGVYGTSNTGDAVRIKDANGFDDIGFAVTNNYPPGQRIDLLAVDLSIDETFGYENGAVELATEQPRLIRDCCRARLYHSLAAPAVLSLGPIGPR
jgi:hypothetical protein